MTIYTSKGKGLLFYNRLPLFKINTVKLFMKSCDMQFNLITIPIVGSDENV